MKAKAKRDYRTDAQKTEDKARAIKAMGDWAEVTLEFATKKKHKSRWYRPQSLSELKGRYDRDKIAKLEVLYYAWYFKTHGKQYGDN